MRKAPKPPAHFVAAMLFAALTAAGCATNPRVLDPDEMGGRQRWTASDRVDVAISEADRNRVDSWPASRDVATGSVWVRLFVGEPGKAPLFTITSATIREETIALGLATRMNYTIEGSLSFDGHDYLIRGREEVNGSCAFRRIA